LRDGTFTGIYGNVLTPVEFLEPFTWKTTDLFLDLWLDRTGGIELLDEDEYEAAVTAGWLSATQAQEARMEILRLLKGWRAGSWPPSVVHEWTLERAGEVLAEANPEEKD
jgi:predicted RNA-binding protein associated with RNAse of E/G family